MGTTFHRAFDCTRDPHSALADLVVLDCERELTAGRRETALQGAPLIRELSKRAHGRIVILPGAVITSGNIVDVATATGAHEFHASAKCQLQRKTKHHSALREMSADELRSDPDEIRAMLRALRTVTTPEGA